MFHRYKLSKGAVIFFPNGKIYMNINKINIVEMGQSLAINGQIQTAISQWAPSHSEAREQFKRLSRRANRKVIKNSKDHLTSLLARNISLPIS